MYSIIANSREVGVVESPTYIRQQRNGAYALCDESIAQGIAFDGSPYQLAEREQMSGELTTVQLVHINAGARIIAQEAVSSIAFVTLAESGSIDNVTAGEHLDMFLEWDGNGVKYEVGQLRRYGGKLYRVIQAHTSQPDWSPDKAVSLFSATSDPAEEWPDWTPVVSALDVYPRGAKVTHKGKHWTSDVDNNSWEPGVFGWTEVT